MQINIQEICTALDNSAGVTTDSRGDVKGKLFIPLAGGNSDGHDYIQSALEKGASYALSERKNNINESNNQNAPNIGAVIRVKSTRRALTDLALYARSKFKGAVVAITGSAGKTTTKEMIAHVLARKFKTKKTMGNFNNDIGLPLSVFQLTPEDEVLVLEMGMNHGGEIHELSLTGAPNIAVITNIGDAHIENLGSREGILKAKSEIFEGLSDGGTVILNGDDPLLNSLPKVPHAAKTIYCKMEEASGIKSHGLRGTTCKIQGQTIEIPFPGDHMIMNALMSFAVGSELGLTAQEIAEGIKNFEPSGNRMEIRQADGMTIINDTYNASPPSVKAAIDMLKGENGRKVAILGDMLELGSFAEDMHREIGRYAAGNLDCLIAIGKLSRYMYEACKDSKNSQDSKGSRDTHYYEDKESFINEWQSILRQGDIVLVKASRGMALEAVVKSICGK
jgi:UDP-N-acetylmuramoyl-tripeptide--D-alanyl-D-alanine ligase